ncbi:MAG: PorV/PorQ family protein [Bacteroidota bacterium]|nr:PorV/PorQ family protein [Bacteroidota bacterium]
MNKKLYILLLLVLFSSNVFSQTAKYSNEFLSIGVGARALGMANTNVANVSDVSSAYWNPAGLTGIDKKFDASMMHAEYFTGIAKYDYFGASMSLDTNSRIATSLIRFGVDDIPNTTDLIDKDGNIDYDRISYFSAADYAFLFSYATKSKIQGLSYGANVKIIYRNIGKFANAWGFGLDAGIKYKYRKWQFAAMGKDITSTFNVWSFNEDELLIEVNDSIFNFAPEDALELTMPRVIIGVARKFNVYKKFSALLEFDLDFTTDGKRNVLINSNFFSIAPRIGVEFDYNNFVFVRLGACNFQKVKTYNMSEDLSLQPNFGVGVKYKGFRLDYALTDIGDNSVAMYSNIFSLSYSFN